MAKIGMFVSGEVLYSMRSELAAIPKLMRHLLFQVHTWSWVSIPYSTTHIHTCTH